MMNFFSRFFGKTSQENKVLLDLAKGVVFLDRELAIAKAVLGRVDTNEEVLARLLWRVSNLEVTVEGMGATSPAQSIETDHPRNLDKLLKLVLRERPMEEELATKQQLCAILDEVIMLSRNLDKLLKLVLRERLMEEGELPAKKPAKKKVD